MTIPHRGRIYEDRLQLAYNEIARWQPRMIVACLGSDSFEMLRLAPPECRRVGMVQSHDPSVYDSLRHYAPWLDAMVGVSAEISHHLATLPEFSRCRIELIQYGISFPKSTERPVTSEDQPLRIIYLGRMVEEQKRVSRLVQLVKRLDQRGENCRFTFVGSGPQTGEIKSALASFRSVEFTGEVTNYEAQRLLETQDVLILLSDYEGLPLSLLEAMGQGVVPVVSELASGIREAVTSSCGIRVPVGDVQAAADAIVALSRDRQRLSAMARSASAFARQNYSAERMASEYLQLVDTLAAETAVWPKDVYVPTPLGVRPEWLFSGLPRLLRRAVKRTFGRFFP
jgi:glycosyltransferase involved in cell wall biosynthesis